MALSFKAAVVTEEDEKRGGRKKSTEPNEFAEAVAGLELDNPKSALEWTFPIVLHVDEKDPSKNEKPVTKGMEPAELRKYRQVAKFAEKLDEAGEENTPRVTVRKRFTSPKDGQVTGKFWVVTFVPRKTKEEVAAEKAAKEAAAVAEKAAKESTTPAA